MIEKEARRYLRLMFRDVDGHVAVAVKGPGDAWSEESFTWPSGQEAVLAWAEANEHGEVFICPALRSTAGPRKANDPVALRWLWADVDMEKVPDQKHDAVAKRIEQLGTYVVGSGSGDNAHVYVKLTREVDTVEHLRLNLGLRQYLSAKDNKQADNSLLRLPGTFNHKNGAVPVSQRGGHNRMFSPEKLLKLRAWQAVDVPHSADATNGWTRVDVTDALRSGAIRQLVGVSTEDAIERFGRRHRAVSAVVAELAKRKLSPDEIHTLMDDFQPAIDKRQDEHGAYDVHRDVSRCLARLVPNERAAPGVSSGRLALTWASTIKPRRVAWGWQPDGHGRMPVGEITLVAGREGIGKSRFLYWMAAQLTRGTLPGAFYGKPRPVLYVAREDSWKHSIVPGLLAADADLSKVAQVEVAEGDDAGLTLPDDCDDVVDLALSVDAAALMLDPIISTLNDELSENRSRQLRKALEPLKAAIERAKIMAPSVVHFNKTQGVDVLSKIPGGRAWGEVARAVIALAQDEESGEFVLSQIKNNLGRLDLPHLAYVIEGRDVGMDDGSRDDVGALRWTGESDRSVREILDHRAERRGRDASDTTKMIKQHVLASRGPLMVADVQGAFPDVKPETVARTLARLADRDELEKVARGMYGRPREVSED